MALGHPAAHTGSDAVSQRPAAVASKTQPRDKRTTPDRQFVLPCVHDFQNKEQKTLVSRFRVRNSVVIYRHYHHFKIATGYSHILSEDFVKTI